MAATVLLLTGCAAGPDAPASTTADTASATTAPLVAETPATPDVDDADAAFLEQVRENLPVKTVIPNATDAQLLAAGREACQRTEAGEAGEEISVIEGEELAASGYYLSSLVIVQAARKTLCIPE